MSIEKLKDYEGGRTGEVKRWLEELEIADKWEKTDWRDRADAVIERYEGKTHYGNSSFNVLHSNTETLRPLLFSQAPSPDVRRRTKLPQGPEKAAAEVIEAALTYAIDCDDYEPQIEAVVNDVLLPGRGVARVRYTPTTTTRREPVMEIDGIDGDTQYFIAGNVEIAPENIVMVDDLPFVEYDALTYEKVTVEHVPWKDFRHQPGKRWEDVRWIAFRSEYTFDEFAEAFGKTKADKAQFTLQGDRTATRSDDTDGQPDFFNKAEVWEIWDKAERQVVFVCKGYLDGPLATIDDGPDFYDLEGFFPTPRPLLAIHSPSSLLPIPEFTIYQDLANELDKITERIERIVDAIRVTGAYDGAVSQLSQILKKENELVPIDNWRDLYEKGGLQGVVDFVPLDGPIKALVALYQQRQIILDTIYQTVGIGDIQRSQSDPRETLGAQQLKAGFGQRRQSSRQREVQRYLRDLMRIQAEIIAQKFQPETIARMAGVPMIPPEVLELLRNDALRNFAIDVETDSTSAPDQQRDIAEIGALMQGIGAFAQASQGIPQGARMPLLRSVLRRLHLGRDVELAVEEAAAQPQQPDPDTVKAQQDAQVKMATVKQKEIDSKRKFELEAQELMLKARELGMKEDEIQAELLMAMAKDIGGGDAQNLRAST
jgi:hypothetical protein